LPHQYKFLYIETKFIEIKLNGENMAWSEDRIAKLKEFWDKGLSASQIAVKLAEGVTRNAIIGKAHRLKLKPRPSPVRSEASKPKKVAPKPKIKKENAKTVSLLELSERVCKWPIGHPGEEDFHFCGRESQPVLPYCPEHCAMAYQAQAPRKDKRASK
jgi:GcrA cell cycle regulator